MGLLATDRAIVTAIAGTTRDTLEEWLEWQGHSVVLIDTAGLRPTTNVVEKKGLERTKSAQAHADLIFYVVDSHQRVRSAYDDDLKTMDPHKTVIVLNKSDLQCHVKNEVFEKMGFKKIVSISALKGTGLEELKKVVLETISATDEKTVDAVVVSQQRHIDHLEKAVAKLNQALKATAHQQAEESIALDLREALQELGNITGDNVSNDVLSAIFSTFCIGK